MSTIKKDYNIIIKKRDEKSYDVFYDGEWVAHILSKPDSRFDSVVMIHGEYRSIDDWNRITTGIESYFFKNKNSNINWTTDWIENSLFGPIELYRKFEYDGMSFIAHIVSKKNDSFTFNLKLLSSGAKNEFSRNKPVLSNTYDLFSKLGVSKENCKDINVAKQLAEMLILSLIESKFKSILFFTFAVVNLGEGENRIGDLYGDFELFRDLETNKSVETNLNYNILPNKLHKILLVKDGFDNDMFEPNDKIYNGKFKINLEMDENTMIKVVINKL